MRKHLLLACTLALAALAITLPSAQAQPVTSVSKTSFDEVTSQLDPGGNFYLYLGTAQWLEHLAGKTESWREKFAAMPDARPEDITNINKAFDLVGRLITDSGLQDITGVGMSSVEVEKGIYRNKMLLHHYPGKSDGFLWKLCGGPPHPLTGLDLLPANTALAIFSDADLPLLWTVAQDEVAKSGFPAAQKFLDQLPAKFEQNTKLKWADVLNSLGGEFGFVITLDESNTVPVPLPGGLIDIPDPAMFLVLKVNDDTIFNRIADELGKNPMVISNDSSGVRMRTVPVPLPLAINLRPTAASSGGYLIIASSDAVVNQALAVKAGTVPGLKSTAEFQHLSQGLPDTGNQFSYMSARFGATMMEVQKQVMRQQAAKTGGRGQTDFFNSLFNSQRIQCSYSVGQNTPTGCLTIGNGSQSIAALALLPAVAVPGMLAAIAVPNFVKARSTSQKNACINNLRQIDAAKNQWALENNKKTGDVPTEDDLKPYIGPAGGHFPKCPAGGVYTIGAIGEPPTCSIPKHVLPQ